MYRIGIVGCGRVAIGHLQAIAASERWTLAGIAEIDAAQLEKVRAEHKPEFACADYRELIDKANLDAIVVSTHLDTHHRIATDALDAGLHVLCEKPMASTIAQCREMVDKADETNRLLAINFNTRSGPLYRRFKKIAESGVLGKIRVVRFVFNWSCHQWQPPERLRHFMEGGGPILDSAVHFFEGVRWYTGSEIARIDCSGVILDPWEHPQHAIASCQMENGSVALIEVGWLYTKRTKDAASFFQNTIIGDDGTVEFDSVGGVLRLWTRDGTQEIAIDDITKHFEVAFDAFARSIDAGELLELASGYDGLKATEAAYRALESAHRQ